LKVIFYAFRLFLSGFNTPQLAAVGIGDVCIHFYCGKFACPHWQLFISVFAA